MARTATDRPRRHGQGVSGRARRRRFPAIRRTQIDPPGRRFGRIPAPLRAGAADSGLAESSGDRTAAGWRTRPRWASVSGHGACGGAAAGSRLRRTTAGRRATRGLVHQDRQRGRLRAPQSDRASRPQAFQHHRHRGRRSEAARFRYRESALDPGGGGANHDSDCAAPVHAGIRSARAGARPAGDDGDRHFPAGIAAVRVADRPVCAADRRPVAKRPGTGDLPLPAHQAQPAHRRRRSGDLRGATDGASGAAPEAARRSGQHRAEGAAQGTGAPLRLGRRNDRRPRTLAARPHGARAAGNAGLSHRKVHQASRLGRRRRPGRVGAGDQLRSHGDVPGGGDRPRARSSPRRGGEGAAGAGLGAAAVRGRRAGAIGRCAAQRAARFWTAAGPA